MPDISGQLGMRTRNPYFDEEADRERHEAYIAREMKPANDLMALFLSKKDEMAALSEHFRAPAIDVACVFEALAEWHHELLKRAG